IRSRIDVDRSWPVHLEDMDTEDLIDTFSEPPQFAERLAPVSVQFGDGYVKGHNWTEMRIKILRNALDLFGMIGRFMESTLQQSGGGAKIPFTSLSLDPDTIHRIVELDYESGESTYQQLIQQISDGTIALSLTTPFHTLLPLLSDTEVRLCARISFIFYLRLIKKYQDFLKRHNEEGLVVMPFWIPENAYQQRVGAIIEEEFRAFCKKERLGRPHLVFLLDSNQASYRENDVLMKSWNLVSSSVNGHLKHETPKKGAKGAHSESIHPAVEASSVVFRDRAFSDWVVYANPSVKKLLDRTIAKVDSDLNAQGVHYCWAHFEDLDGLTHSSKSILNLKQKLVKLAELGYVPLSPDFYVRGKLRGHLGCTDIEPQSVELFDNTAGADWHPDSRTFSRWEGLKINSKDGSEVVVEHRKYRRQTPDGFVEVEGPQCWKLGWSKVRSHCIKAVVGDLDTCAGGMAEVLGDFVGGQNARKKSQNVLEFLSYYTYVYWREHFIQHDLSEADINIHEFANEHLRAGLKQNLSEKDAAIAGAAAQAIFFALDSGRSTGTRPEHMDQRGFYQNVSMLTLALCNGAYVYNWLKDTKRARKMVDLIKNELIGFEGAYQRYDLSEYGVKRKNWEEALLSEIDDSKENVVRRAARRVAAVHLRPLGYTRDFSRDDELTTTSVGHLWTDEIANINCKYENPYFCGVREA
ncbi:hypothetical protein HY256_06680, partial [Candidatus Sumerlaeota bacterium]|nr:hypothetical protein [Candidatus Sumerlaeota bacterium]